jgi:two-component system chemotaxis response regulator CheB
LSHTEKIKVIIVDDSAVFRGFWGRIISASSDIEVVTTASDGLTGVSTVKNHEVDVVLLDIEMPRMNGLQALPEILKSKPNVKVIIASSLTREGSRTAIEALALGASEYIAKPAGIQQNDALENLVHELLAKIRALGARNKRLPSNKSIITEIRKFIQPPKLLVIGTSTGGPNALSYVLQHLSAKVELPILIVQHMPPEFTRMLAERLGKDAGRIAFEGAAGQKVQSGHIYVGPGDFHMEVERDLADNWTIRLNKEAPEHFCRPAVDRLFTSVAKFCHRDVLAVILTGMGEDGRIGCEKIRDSGGIVIAQDEASSVVWGMPGAVVRAGLAHYVTPLNEVAQKIESLVL